MKVITTSILTSPAKLFVSLFTIFSITSSCEDPSSIGLILDPENNQIGVFYQEIPLSASVVLWDSISTLNTGFLLYGNEESDFFGKTEATGYSRLFFNRDVRRPEPNAVLDSVRFNIYIRHVLGDNLDSPKTINIHLLQEQIKDLNYYNFNSLSYDPQPVISTKVDFKAKQDTIVSISVNNQFVEGLFAEMKGGVGFNDIFSFREFFPGVVFKGAENEDVSFNTQVGNNTGFVFFYKNEGDTISRAYPISTGINNNFARHFSQIVNDPTGTPTEVVQNKMQAYNLGHFAGVKSGLGMLVKLDMSPLDAFLDTLENVTFNQVRLEMGPLVSNKVTNLPPQSQIMYFTNETNRILFRTDNNPMAVQQDGTPQVDPDRGEPIYLPQNIALLFHLKESNTLAQLITSHVNAIYRKKVQRRDFLLYPGAPPRPGFFGNDDFRESLREYVVDQNTIKLKIFYSKVRSL
ncbi:protein of unknown function [Aquiflexum balticum DSM 16537]|uniref:DUF4270 domain-containing protein n=1 Tax=Aquiflexum balticum DSM 16537 TaxID=758820 RepID=A0A1W2H1Y8_9BACT|nr:protein of unknown function [Aquiflexum balticum DSM 16537]